MRWKRDRDFLYFSSRFHMTRKVPWIPFSSDRIDGSLDTLFPLSTVSSYHIYQMYHRFDICNSSVQANSQPLWSLQIPNPSSDSYVFQRNWMLRNMWETLEWKSVASRHSAQNGRVSTNCPRFLNREIQCLFFSNLSKPQIFWGQDFYN